MNNVTEITIGSSRIPQGVKFNPRPIRGTMTMESPMESVIRSMRSISSFFGKSPNINLARKGCVRESKVQLVAQYIL